MRTQCGWLSAVLLLLLAGGIRAQQAGEAEQWFAKEREQIEASVKALPSLGAFSIDQTVQFRVREGMLELRTSLGSTDGAAAVQLKDVAGLATSIDVQGKTERGPAGVPRLLTFQHWDLSRPLTIAHTQVLFTPGHLQVVRTEQGFAGDRSVELIQGVASMAGGDEPVRLYVKGYDEAAERDTSDLKLEAPSFAELRRRYPREMAEYVQPIFRALRQEGAVFGVDPRVVWQVFADTWKPAAELATQVKGLVTKLDAEAVRDRESALADLQKLGQPAALTLMGMDRRSLSEEQNSQIDAFLLPYKKLSDAEAGRLRKSPDFLLDCLYVDDEPLRASALAELKQVTGKAIAFNVKAESEARFAVIAELRRQLLPPPATQTIRP